MAEPAEDARSPILYEPAPIPHLRRYADPRSGVPYVTTTVRIYGARQIATFEALCEATGRRPHQLAADIVVEHVWEVQSPKGKMGRLGRRQQVWRIGLLNRRRRS